MMNEILTRVEAVEAELKLRTKGKKEKAVAKWMSDLRYSLGHMDESEYGFGFLRNIEAYLDIHDDEYVEIADRVVNNTLFELCNRLEELLKLPASKLTKLVKRDVRETLLPESRWLYRGWRCYLKRNKHSFTVQMVAEQHAYEQDIEIMLDKLMMSMENLNLLNG